MNRAGRPRRSARRIVAAAVIVFTTFIAGGTAHADPAGPTDYRSEILTIEPPTETVTIEVIGGDSFIQLTVEPGTEVLIKGYFGEPYLRFLTDGTVEENRNSPTTYQNEERYGSDAPDFASADADPDWVPVGDDGTFAWHDHRAHWMQPIRPAGQEPGDRIVEAVIPILVDDVEVEVTVISTWQPEPSVVPALLGGIVGALSVGTAIWLSRRTSAWAVALIPVALAATIAGWWQFTSLPAETDPRLVWPLLPSLALIASVAALPLRRHSAFTALAAGLVASSQLMIWAFVKRDGLTAAIVPTNAPQWFERLVLVAAFVAGVGGTAIALVRLFSKNPGTRAVAATT